MTVISEPQSSSHQNLANIAYGQELNLSSDPSVINAILHPNPTTQQLLTSKLVTHTQDAGLNPLVDAAAHIFSLIGKIKHIKSYQNLSKLHDELVEEIESFQAEAKATHPNTEYLSEYIPIATYALCLTLDDVIAEMPWGNQGKWTDYSLVVSFNQESLSRKSFFIILERLIRDPAIYIDVIEFMYICLGLGFKCQYNAKSAAFDSEQLEHITDALYKRIRAFRGNFNKTLSPYSIRSPQMTDTSFFKTIPPLFLAVAVTSVLMLVVFVSKLLISGF